MYRVWFRRSRVWLLAVVPAIVLVVGVAVIALGAQVGRIAALNAPALGPVAFREIAEAHDLDGDTIIAWTRAQRQAADAEKAANEQLARQADLQFELDGAMKPLIRTIEDHREDLVSLALPSDPQNVIAILDALESWLYGTNPPQDPLEFQQYEAVHSELVRLWSVAAPIQSQLGFAIALTNETQAKARRYTAEAEAAIGNPAVVGTGRRTGTERGYR
jgi:hypothetical protein